MTNSASLAPEGFTIFDDRSLIAEEILELRQEEITPDEVDAWRKCIDQSLYVVAVREDATSRLVGVAMLAGNQRHAELVDGTVHPEVRERGIGRILIERLVQYARDEKIKYVGLTYDKKSPWLKEAYERQGFVSIDFAMWLKDSLPSTSE